VAAAGADVDAVAMTTPTLLLVLQYVITTDLDTGVVVAAAAAMRIVRREIGGGSEAESSDSFSSDR